MNTFFMSQISVRGVLALSFLKIVTLSADLTARAYCVTTTQDSGRGSLRDALMCANKSGRPSIITFKMSVDDGGYDCKNKTWCIKPCKELPIITVPLTINGFSQEGSCPNHHTIDQENTSIIKIELCGPLHSSSQSSKNEVTEGLRLSKGADGSHIKGIAVNGFYRGIIIEAHKVRITGMFLGVALDGLSPKPNMVSLLVAKNASKTFIGGCRPKDRNLISGKGQYPLLNGTQEQVPLMGAVTILGNDTTMQGSTINLTRKGDALVLSDALFGIVSCNNEGTTIGGEATMARVIVAGHREANIFYNTTYNDLLYNVFAGTSLNGTQALGGECGLKIVGNASTSVPMIQDPTQIYKHSIIKCVFSGNATSGIFLGQVDDSTAVDKTHIMNTFIGTDITGTLEIPNGTYGVSIDYATDTRIEESIVSYNHLYGIHQDRARGTVIETCTLGLNRLGGIKVEPIAGAKAVRGVTHYEVKIQGTTAQGNGKNGVSTPCGFIQQI